MNETKFNKSKAAEIVGVTRPTFYRHINEKGITVEKDKDGKEHIDLSELIRVYGHSALRIDNENGQADVSKVSKSEEKDVHNGHAVKIAKLEEQNRYLEEQKEHYKDLYEEEKEERKKTTLLLADYSERENRAGDWEKSLKALEARIANQEKTAKEKAEREEKILRENQKLRKAYSVKKQELEAEKSKGFWQKLFG